jgi:hypothetical protein
LEGEYVMTARRLFLVFMIALFFLGLASPGFSGVVGEAVKGTVTRIDGGKVSIRDFMGDEKTVEPINPEAITNLKVGERVSVKEGILTKEGGAGPSAPSPGPKD